MIAMKIKHRQNSVMFYTEHPDNYVSSFQIFLEGNLGIIYTLNGHEFMDLVTTHIEELFKECEIELIMFSMMAPLLRRLRHKLKDKCEFDLLYSFFDAKKRPFSMVLMRLKN
jgi:hypothetical protein